MRAILTVLAVLAVGCGGEADPEDVCHGRLSREDADWCYERIGVDCHPWSTSAEQFGYVPPVDPATCPEEYRDNGPGGVDICTDTSVAFCACHTEDDGAVEWRCMGGGCDYWTCEPPA